jgi:O-antigen/teichoic acid export membrane protein
MSEHAGLRSVLLRGVAWTMAAVLTMQVSRFVIAIVLARLLTPREYGLAAMVLVFSSLVLAFSDLSLGSALVQRQQVTERDRSTVFWTSLAAGSVLTLGGIAVAGPLADFYGESEVRPLFIALSLGFVLASLQTTQASLLQREMRFRVITSRRMAAVVIGGVVGIVMAVLDYGAWALVGQALATSVVSTVLLWSFSSWRPTLTFSLASLRDFGGFGMNLLGARLLNYFNRNTDSLLIGRFLGSSALGAYSLALNIMLLPFSRLVSPIQDVLFPAYSRWQDDRRRLAEVWLRVHRIVAALLVPAMLGLIVVAPDFVPVVFGDQWRPAIPVLQVLAIVGLLQSLAGLGTKVLEALDRPPTILRFSVLELLVTIPAFAVGLQWGVVGVAVCYAAATLPLSLLYVWLATRAVGVPLRSLFAALAGVVEAALLMVAGVWLVRAAFVAAEVDAPIRLAAAVGIGVLLYVPLCAWRAPDLRAEVARFRTRRRQGRVAVAT